MKTASVLMTLRRQLSKLVFATVQKARSLHLGAERPRRFSRQKFRCHFRWDPDFLKQLLKQTRLAHAAEIDEHQRVGDDDHLGKAKRLDCCGFSTAFNACNPISTR